MTGFKRATTPRRLILTERGCLALALMVEIAQQGEKGPIALLATATPIGISLAQAAQLSANLRRIGLVKGSRGPTGGYSLARPACDISVWDIFLAARPARDGAAANGPTSLENPQTRDFRRRLETLLCHSLRQVSLADVVEGDMSRHPLWDHFAKMPTPSSRS